MNRLLRMKQLLEVIPASRSSVYQWIKAGKFPKPIKISERCSAWREEDIQAFIESANSKQH